jgi:exodeoxyribonuclease VII small subunit
MAEKEIEALTFEEALLELEEIVLQLESADLTLEASLALFERGQKVANHCNASLDNAALRIEQLSAEGEIVELQLPAQ